MIKGVRAERETLEHGLGQERAGSHRHPFERFAVGDLIRK